LWKIDSILLFSLNFLKRRKDVINIILVSNLIKNHWSILWNLLKMIKLYQFLKNQDEIGLIYTNENQIETKKNLRINLTLLIEDMDQMSK